MEFKELEKVAAMVTFGLQPKKAGRVWIDTGTVRFMNKNTII